MPALGDHLTVDSHRVNVFGHPDDSRTSWFRISPSDCDRSLVQQAIRYATW